MFGHAMAAHIKVCENYEKVCPECELNYKPNNLPEGAKHNCLEDLKARMSKATQEKEHMEVQLGINYDKVNATCPENHQLLMHRGVVRSYLSGNGALGRA